MALQSNNFRQGIQLEALLYLALLEEGEVESKWQDQEFLTSELGSQVVFGGTRLVKGQEFSKRLRAVVNWNVKKQRTGYVPLSENKRSGHGYARISSLLMNRVLSSGEDAASISCDDLELILSYLDAFESEEEKLKKPQQGTTGVLRLLQ